MMLHSYCSKYVKGLVFFNRSVFPVQNYLQNFMQHYCFKGTKEILRSERIHTTWKPLTYVWLIACTYDCRRTQTWAVQMIFLLLKTCTLCRSVIKWRQYILILGLPTFPLSSLFLSTCARAPTLQDIPSLLLLTVLHRNTIMIRQLWLSVPDPFFFAYATFLPAGVVKSAQYVSVQRRRSAVSKVFARFPTSDIAVSGKSQEFLSHGN